MSPWCLKGVLKVAQVQGYSNSVAKVLRVFQGCFKDVLRVFKGCFQDVKGNLKGISLVF